MSNNHIFFVYQEEVITQEEVTEEAAPEAAPEAETKSEETKGLCLKFLNSMPNVRSLPLDDLVQPMKYRRNPDGTCTTLYL